METEVKLNECTTTILSVRSGRKVAYVELDKPVADIQLQEQPAFKIIKGFGDLWRKYTDNSQLTMMASNEREFFVTIAAFPTDRDGIGYFTIDSIVPTADEIAAQLEQTKRRRRKRKPRSWWQRLTGAR